jgi:hypothetical protein
MVSYPVVLLLTLNKALQEVTQGSPISRSFFDGRILTLSVHMSGKFYFFKKKELSIVLLEVNTSHMSMNTSLIQGKTLSTNQTQVQGFMSPFGSSTRGENVACMPSCNRDPPISHIAKIEGGGPATRPGRLTMYVGRAKVDSTDLHSPRGSTSLAPNGSSRRLGLELASKKAMAPSYK